MIIMFFDKYCGAVISPAFPGFAGIKLELKKAEILRPKAREQQSIAGGDKKSDEYKSLIQKPEKAILPQKQQQEPLNKPLSVDEEKILDLYLQCWTHQQIADELTISQMEVSRIIENLKQNGNIAKMFKDFKPKLYNVCY